MSKSEERDLTKIPSNYDLVNRTIQIASRSGNRTIKYSEGSALDLYLKKRVAGEIKSVPKGDLRKRFLKIFRNGKPPSKLKEGDKPEEAPQQVVLRYHNFSDIPIVPMNFADMIDVGTQTDPIEEHHPTTSKQQNVKIKAEKIVAGPSTTTKRQRKNSFGIKYLNELEVFDNDNILVVNDSNDSGKRITRQTYKIKNEPVSDGNNQAPSTSRQATTSRESVLEGYNRIYQKSRSYEPFVLKKEVFQLAKGSRRKARSAKTPNENELPTKRSKP